MQELEHKYKDLEEKNNLYAATRAGEHKKSACTAGGKNKQLEHVYQIMEGKMHLEVAELEAKLKDAHTIHDTS